jgi:NAD dependent epimerase/dehydratase family enzyme
VPGFALRIAVGELAEALVGGQRARPAAAQRWGYDFAHPTLDGALAEIFGAS